MSLKIVKWHIRSRLLNILLFCNCIWGNFLKGREGELCILCSMWLHNENSSAEARIKMIFFLVQMKYKTVMMSYINKLISLTNSVSDFQFLVFSFFILWS